MKPKASHKSRSAVRMITVTLAFGVSAGLLLGGCPIDDQSEQTTPAEKGDAGVPCWDLNANGVADLATEDTNGDGVVNVLDCRGEDGHDGGDGEDGLPCWDLNGNGVGDPEEDINADDEFNALDCKGDTGDPGEPGDDGLACWDLNGNGVPDVATEDTNGDGVVNIDDCRGDGLDCADCDNRFVNEGQADAIDTAMIQDGALTGPKLAANCVDSSNVVNNSLTADDLGANAVDTTEIANGAVTQAKILATGASSGKVLKMLDASNMYWGTDETDGGGSCLWSEGSGGNIYYNGGNVGIGEDDPDNKLHIEGSDAGDYALYVHHPTGDGVLVEADDPGGYAIKAWSTASTDSGRGLWAVCSSNTGWAGYFTGRVKVNGELYVDGDIVVENGDIYPAFHLNGDRVGKPDKAWSEMWSAEYNYASSRDEKKQIEALDRQELSGMLRAVEAIDVVHFLYKNERLNSEPDVSGKQLRPRSVPRLGVIAETLPAEVASQGASGVSLPSYSAMLHAALKELSQRVREQDTRINELEAQLKALKGEE